MLSKLRIALATIALLAVPACGDDGGDTGAGDEAGPSTESTETSEATEATADTAAPPDENDLAALDYEAALFSIDDLAGIFPGQYRTADEGSMADVTLRALCGADYPALEAVAGHLLELQNEEPTISITTSVHAFATEKEAEDEFGILRGIANSCTAYQFDADATIEISPEIGEASAIPEAGDESFVLFGRKSDTGLVVGDRFVRSGLFVFDTRFAIDATSPFPDATPRFVSTEADQKFVTWVEEQF